LIKWVKQFINIHIGWDILSGPEGGGSRILLFIIQFLTFISLNNVTTIFPSRVGGVAQGFDPWQQQI
jgi:hypothetical protein